MSMGSVSSERLYCQQYVDKLQRPESCCVDILHSAPSKNMEQECHRQSPVDLPANGIGFDSELRNGTLTMNWHPTDCRRIVNGGYTWTVECDSHAKSTLLGPHLSDTYKLAQFHAHWGTHDCDGSEHTVDGREFAGEIHFVHYKASYGSLQAALPHGDGLAVVALMIEEIDGEDNESFNGIACLLDQIRNPMSKVDLPSGFDFAQLLPKEDVHHFWTYPGSLTTPPYTECVIWTILKTPIQISSLQMNAMRELKERNVRECFPLGGRVVRTSFDS